MQKFYECKRTVPAVHAPLQHKCDELCEWLTCDHELYICQASQAMHTCSLQLCGYRSDAGPLGHQKGQGSHSVCMLTGIIREPIEFGMPEYGTSESENYTAQPFKSMMHPKPATLADRLRANYTKNHLEAQQIATDLLADAREDKPESLVEDLGTICVRMWHIVHNKANRMLDKSPICKFADLCLVVLYDISMVGLSHCEEAGNMDTLLTILPVHPYLRDWMPPPSAISNYTSNTTGQPFVWNINNSKCLHTAIASLEREQQEVLADEVRDLQSFSGL